jgi:hypothetical protein
MKCLPVLALFGAIALGQSDPRTVYVLPMAGGFDQFLAECLTYKQVMRVVTDPKIADTVLTDHLGEAFEQKMAEIHPKDDKKSDSATLHTFRSSQGRGTIFLVDAKSRHVLWSDYEKVPGVNSNNNMMQEAERVAKKLQISTTEVPRVIAPPSASASPIAPTPNKK